MRPPNFLILKIITAVPMPGFNSRQKVSHEYQKQSAPS